MKSPIYLYGVLEGASTLGMTLAYLYAGGNLTSLLFWIYIAHFLASFVYHIFPNKWTRFIDLSTIHLMIMERGYLKTRSIWVYVCCLASLWSMPCYDFMVLVHAAVVSAQGKTTYDYMCLWMIVLLFYLYSCIFQILGDERLTMLTCVLYHSYLAVLSAMEVRFYLDGTSTTADGLVRYCVYFLWFSYVMTRITTNPRRLRSILSFLTALVLSPLSFYQIYRQIQCGGRIKPFQGDQDVQSFMSNFYLAYVVADVVVGMAYYPEYFTLLEGWLHHIGTFSFVGYTYYGNPVKRIFISVSMVVETPSILLFLSRIFYDATWALTLKKKYFYPIFFMFRIIIPTLLIIYLHHLCDISSYFIYTSFTALNLYWLIRMWR